MSTSLPSLTDLLLAMENDKSSPVEHVSEEIVKSVSSSEFSVSSDDSDIDCEV